MLSSLSGGSNIYILKSRHEALIIDSGLPADQELLLKALSTLSLNQTNVIMVLHTHGHLDHIGCSSVFGKAELAMHKHDAIHVNMADTVFMLASMFGFQKHGNLTITRMLADGDVVQFGDITLQVIHTPGHTAGSVCYLEPNKGWLFSGDTLFSDATGRTDLPTGNKEQLATSLTRLLELDFSVLLPGHGAPRDTEQKENIENLLYALRL
jgi:glyoxylase-like metal-dependent hydrolase (beta-lactamase superfamily II)